MDPRSIVETIPVYTRTKLTDAQKEDIHDRFGNHVPFKDSTFGRNGRGRHTFQLTFIQYQGHLKSFTDEGLRTITVRLIFDYTAEMNSQTGCKNFISKYDHYLDDLVVKDFFHLDTKQTEICTHDCHQRISNGTWCESCHGEPHALDMIKKEMTNAELIGNLDHLKDCTVTDVVTPYSEFDWKQDGELEEYLDSQHEIFCDVRDKLYNFDQETERLITQLQKDRAELQTKLIDQFNSHDHCHNGRKYLDEIAQSIKERRVKELEAEEQQAQVAKQERLASLEAKRQAAIALAAELAREIEQSK